MEERESRQLAPEEDAAIEDGSPRDRFLASSGILTISRSWGNVVVSMGIEIKHFGMLLMEKIKL